MCEKGRNAPTGWGRSDLKPESLNFPGERFAVDPENSRGLGLLSLCVFQDLPDVSLFPDAGKTFHVEHGVLSKAKTPAK